MGSRLAKDSLRGFYTPCRSQPIAKLTANRSGTFKREVEAPEENHSKFGGE